MRSHTPFIVKLELILKRIFRKRVTTNRLRKAIKRDRAEKRKHVQKLEQ